MTTRGLRLNNPGNIIISPSHWLGKVAPSRDEKFETFDSMEHGCRALAKTLLTYYRDYDLDTIRMIIKRWAPPEENNTQAYIDDVSERMGIAADATLELLSNIILASLVKSIIIHENGADMTVTDVQIDRGVEMALA